MLHPRQVRQSYEGWETLVGSGVGEVGAFSVYGAKLHLLYLTNRVPSYEFTPADVADVLLVEELLAEIRLGGGVERRLLGPSPTATRNSRRSWRRAACC